MRRYHRSLKQLIRSVCGRKPEYGAEIGVWKGECTEILCNRFQSCHVFAIDPWDSKCPQDYVNQSHSTHLMPKDNWHMVYLEAVQRLKDKNCSIIRATSREAAREFDDNFFDFVFIDGDHSYEGVKEDIHLWLPKTKKLLCGHDYGNQRNRLGIFGVDRAVNEIFGSDGFKVYPGGVWAVRV